MTTMSIGKFRSPFYLTAKLPEDFNAILRGRIAQRIGLRIAGKATGRLLGRWLR